MGLVHLIVVVVKKQILKKEKKWDSKTNATSCFVLAFFASLHFLAWRMLTWTFPTLLLAMADRIIDEETGLLDLPHGLPTFSDIEKARLAQKDQQAVKQGHDIFLWLVWAKHVYK